MINFITWLLRKYLGVQTELDRFDDKLQTLREDITATFSSHNGRQNEQYKANHEYKEWTEKRLVKMEQDLKSADEKMRTVEESLQRNYRFIESLDKMRREDTAFLIQIADPKTMRKILDLSVEEAATLLGLTEVQVLEYEHETYPPPEVLQMMYDKYKAEHKKLYET